MKTTFAQMSVGQRKRWLDWAKSHEWGANPPRFVARNETIEMEVSSGFMHSDEIETAYFDNPRDLRAWAGY